MEPFLTDKYDVPITINFRVSYKGRFYNVIADPYLGLCLEECQSKSLEILTEDLAKEVEVVDDIYYRWN